MTSLDKILKAVRDKRYAQDFEQEKKIGRGGYASVYKSKNVLDDQYYAVKKIKLKVKQLKKKMDEEIDRVLQEVKVLAKVNHQNILRYYNSWLEVQYKESRKDSFALFEKKEDSPPSNLEQKLPLKCSRDYEELDDQFDDDNIVFSNEEESSGQNNETRANPRDNDDTLDFTEESPTLLFEGSQKEVQANGMKKMREKKPELGDSGMSIFNSMKKVQIADKFADFARKINKELEEPATKLKAAKANGNHSFDGISKGLRSARMQNCAIQLEGKAASSIGKGNRETGTKSFKKLDQDEIKPQQASDDKLEKIKSITLYIQTELCNSTLEEYITERNQLLEKKKNNPEFLALKERFAKEALKFALEIVNGMEYIHKGCHMVHRDLKPSNIFLTENKVIKIGDFGLVKKMKSLSPFQPSPLSLSPIVSGVPTPDRNSFLEQQEKIETFTLDKGFEQTCEFELKIDDDEKLSAAENSPARIELSFDDFDNDMLGDSPIIAKGEGAGVHLLNSPRAVENFTKDVGTRTFASPEQLSADSENFDDRADIWSLGIVFLLLFHPMTTHMEQTRAIAHAKKGTLPAKFEAELPAIAAMIKKMLSTDPNQRPYLKDIEIELKKPSETGSKFYGKVLVRREGSQCWKERWLKVTDTALLIYKGQLDRKADLVFNLNDWRVTLKQEDLAECTNVVKLNESSVPSVNSSTVSVISIENQIQLGYEITAEDTSAILLIHKQITNN